MAFSMLPSIIIDSITDLTPDFLAERGIELLMLDFDNTIVPYTTDTPEPLMEQWLYDMKMSDIKICIVSNSKNQRVRIFCKNYGLDCITHAKKPFPKGIRECLAKYDISAENAALIGDQIFTDVLGGNLFGCHSILVEPIQPESTAFFKFKRFLEKIILFFYRKRA